MSNHIPPTTIVRIAVSLVLGLGIFTTHWMILLPILLLSLWFFAPYQEAAVLVALYTILYHYGNQSMIWLIAPTTITLIIIPVLAYIRERIRV
ncbi:MAG: hypothetical protein AAB447_01375 [Patescibacteria group bacterium]